MDLWLFSGSETVVSLLLKSSPLWCLGLSLDLQLLVQVSCLLVKCIFVETSVAQGLRLDCLRSINQTSPLLLSVAFSLSTSLTYDKIFDFHCSQL